MTGVQKMVEKGGLGSTIKHMVLLSCQQDHIRLCSWGEDCSPPLDCGLSGCSTFFSCAALGVDHYVTIFAGVGLNLPKDLDWGRGMGTCPDRLWFEGLRDYWPNLLDCGSCW